MRWQVMTSLALGAKGVMYFCYWTPNGADFSLGQAIMTPAPGSKPDLANQVRKSPSWPRSWANFSLLQLCSHRNAWANLHLLGPT